MDFALKAARLMSQRFADDIVDREPSKEPCYVVAGVANDVYWLDAHARETQGT